MLIPPFFPALLGNSKNCGAAESYSYSWDAVEDDNLEYNLEILNKTRPLTTGLTQLSFAWPHSRQDEISNT